MLYFKIHIYLMDYSGCSCKNLDHLHLHSAMYIYCQFEFTLMNTKLKKSIAAAKQGWQHITGKIEGS